MHILLSVNAIIFTFIGFVWTPSNWLNIILKLIFVSLGITNTGILLYSLGYIVKITA